MKSKGALEMRRILVLALVVFALVLPQPTIAQVETPLTVHFLNAQRDAILLDYGDMEMLIDGGVEFRGTTTTPNTIAADYIRPFVQGPLDYVVATHQHKDHVGGLLYVYQQYDVGQTIWNGDDFTLDSSTDGSRALFLQAMRAEGTSRIVKRGDTIPFGPMQIEVMNPPGLIWPTSANDMSIVLKVTYGPTSVLLMGDAGVKYAEPDMLAKGVDVKAQIFKLGHHGLKNSTSPAFALATQAKIAVSQSSKPEDLVMQSLGPVNPAIYYNGLHGHIVFTLSGQGYTVQTQTGKAPVYSPYAGATPTPTPTPAPITVTFSGSVTTTNPSGFKTALDALVKKYGGTVAY